MKKYLLSLTLCLLITQSFSQIVTKRSNRRDSVVYTPVSLMERTMNELKDCDKMREDMITLRVLLGDQSTTYTKLMSSYKDSLTEARYQYTKSVGLIEDLNDSIAVQNALLHKADRSYTKLRRSRRVWSIIAIGTVTAIVGVHLHWKNGPTW